MYVESVAISISLLPRTHWYESVPVLLLPASDAVSVCPKTGDPVILAVPVSTGFEVVTSSLVETSDALCVVVSFIL